jgi:hypothetical protein
MEVAIVSLIDEMERILEEMRAAAPAPQWSKDRPTLEGHYYCALRDSWEICLVRVYWDEEDVLRGESDVFYSLAVISEMSDEYFWMPTYYPGPPQGR